MAFDRFVAHRTSVNATAFDARIFVMFDSVTVINLNFIAAHQIHAGIGMLWNPKFNMEFEIAEFRLAYQIDRMPLCAVDKYAFAGSYDPLFRVVRIERNGFCGHPISWFSPSAQIF